MPATIATVPACTGTPRSSANPPVSTASSISARCRGSARYRSQSPAGSGAPGPDHSRFPSSVRKSAAPAGGRPVSSWAASQSRPNRDRCPSGPNVTVTVAASSSTAVTTRSSGRPVIWNSFCPLPGTRHSGHGQLSRSQTAGQAPTSMTAASLRPARISRPGRAQN